MDLCEEKKFIDMTRDITLLHKKNILQGLKDDKNNVWMKYDTMTHGGHGTVYLLKSHNKDYTDLAIKDIEEDRSRLEESLIINLFNKYRCKNFLNIGILTGASNKDLIVMEKIDGDLTNLDFEVYNNPMKIFINIVKFIISGFRCAMKKNKYYYDIKMENIGYRVCKDNIKFTFLDMGSFFDINEPHKIIEESVTYKINEKAFKKGNFSNDIVIVYGTIIMFLVLRLKMISYEKEEKFENLVYKSQFSKKYPNTNFLEKDLYLSIKKLFYKLFDTEDEFIDKLFECLKIITYTELSVDSFLRKIDHYV